MDRFSEIVQIFCVYLQFFMCVAFLLKNPSNLRLLWMSIIFSEKSLHCSRAVCVFLQVYRGLLVSESTFCACLQVYRCLAFFLLKSLYSASVLGVHYFFSENSLQCLTAVCVFLLFHRGLLFF